MDNASYHSPSKPGTKQLSKMNKADLQARLIECGIRPGKKLRDQLYDELKAHYKLHPELKPKSWIGEIMANKDWQLLYTPPMEPKLQPIEKIWGQVKNIVAAMYHINRTMEQTLVHLKHAFYTHCYGEHKKRYKGEAGITEDHCLGSVQKSESFMASFIRDHPDLLQGTVTDLKFIDTLLPFHSLNATNAAEMTAQLADENEEDAEFERRVTGGPDDSDDEEDDERAVSWTAANAAAAVPSRSVSTVAAGIMMTLPAPVKWRRILLSGRGDEVWNKEAEEATSAELLLRMQEPAVVVEEEKFHVSTLVELRSTVQSAPLGGSMLMAPSTQSTSSHLVRRLFHYRG